jgi:hypothetical protein
MTAIGLAGAIYLALSDIDNKWKLLAGGILLLSCAVWLAPGLDPQTALIVSGSLSALVGIWGIAHWQMP